MIFVGLSWDDKEAWVVMDAVGSLLAEVAGTTAFVVVVIGIVVGFCMFPGRPFIQDVRGLESAVAVDVFFGISLPRSCSSTFSAALALLARCI
jgi:hypothetical protein